MARRGSRMSIRNTRIIAIHEWFTKESDVVWAEYDRGTIDHAQYRICIEALEKDLRAKLKEVRERKEP